MKVKLDVEFQVLFHDSRVGAVIHSYNVKKAGSNLKNPESYYMHLIDDMGKTSLMDKNDIHMIIDYRILNMREVLGGSISKEGGVASYVYAVESSLLSNMQLSDEFILDIKLMCERMHESIKGLPVERQLDIVMTSLRASYEVRNAALSAISRQIAEYEGQKCLK